MGEDGSLSGQFFFNFFQQGYQLPTWYLSPFTNWVRLDKPFHPAGMCKGWTKHCFCAVWKLFTWDKNICLKGDFHPFSGGISYALVFTGGDNGRTGCVVLLSKSRRVGGNLQAGFCLPCFWFGTPGLWQPNLDCPHGCPHEAGQHRAEVPAATSVTVCPP